MSRRLSPLLVLLAVMAAACGGGDGSATTTSATTTSATTTSATTTSVATTSSDAAGTEPTTSTVTPTPAGPEAPDFALALADGSTFTLSDQQQPVFMVFWAEWCPPCGRELPVVDEVAADYLDEVTFLAVAGKSDADRAEERAAQLFSDNLAWGLDDSIWDLYGILGQPATVLISGDVIVDRWFGELGESTIRERLEAALAVSG